MQSICMEVSDVSTKQTINDLKVDIFKLSRALEKIAEEHCDVVGNMEVNDVARKLRKLIGYNI